MRCFDFYIFMKGEMEGNCSPFSRINLMMDWGVAGDELQGGCGWLRLAAGEAGTGHGVAQQWDAALWGTLGCGT